MVKHHSNALNKKLIFKPVDKANWSDFQSLFESKGAPGYCWCMVWRMTKKELQENNSKARKGFIKERVFSNTPIGILGYDGEEPVAWCSIAPRDTHQRLGGDESLDDVWSISCFYIKKDYRRQQLTALLIENAIAYAKKNGAKYVEAYPVEPDSPSYRFMGFIKTFEKAGFKFIKMAGTRRHVMNCKV